MGTSKKAVSPEVPAVPEVPEVAAVIAEVAAEADIPAEVLSRIAEAETGEGLPGVVFIPAPASGMFPGMDDAGFSLDEVLDSIPEADPGGGKAPKAEEYPVEKSMLLTIPEGKAGRFRLTTVPYKTFSLHMRAAGKRLGRVVTVSHGPEVNGVPSAYVLWTPAAASAETDPPSAA